RAFPNNNFKNGLSAYECKESLDLAFSEQAPFLAKIYRWFKEFEHERPSVKHQKGVERLSTAVTEENIQLFLGVRKQQLASSAAGATEAATVLKEAAVTTPTRAFKILKALSNQSHRVLSGDKALRRFVENKYTKHQYNNTRSMLMEIGCCAFPAYGKVQKAKSRCYPKIDSITVSEIVQISVLEALGQSIYKQKLLAKNLSDSDIFFTSLAPLRFIRNSDSTLIWQNPRPSSTRFCRHIHFYFKKETAEFARKEANKVKKEIEELQPSTLNINNRNIQVKHILNFMMINGKLINAVTSTTSSQGLLNNVLLSSDPVITPLRKLPAKPTQQLSSAVLVLLLAPREREAETEVLDEPTGLEESSSKTDSD
ncbi:hypothetical protein ILUMI_13664, partial [Ignelater luminosus]